MNKKKKERKLTNLTPLPLSDWRNDWLYSLVLHKAEEEWKALKEFIEIYRVKKESAECENKLEAYIEWAEREDELKSQNVIIEEFCDSEGAEVSGEVMRAWKFDENGLLEIPLKDLQKMSETWYKLIQFHIHSNRKHVVFIEYRRITDNRSYGWGMVLRVQRSAIDAELVFDGGEAWKS